MRTLFSKGEVLHYTVPVAKTVKSGDIVVVGSFAGIAVTDGVTGQRVALAAEQVYRVPVPSTIATIAQGTPVYVVATTGEITLTAGTNIRLGLAWEAGAANGIVPVKLGT